MTGVKRKTIHELDAVLADGSLSLQSFTKDSTQPISKKQSSKNQSSKNQSSKNQNSKNQSPQNQRPQKQRPQKQIPKKQIPIKSGSKARAIDEHMQAAIRLSDDLREAYLCSAYVRRGKETPSQRPIFTHSELRQAELIEVGPTKSIQSKPVGHAICEHLLASLRKQIALETSSTDEYSCQLVGEQVRSRQVNDGYDDRYDKRRTNHRVSSFPAAQMSLL